MKLQNSDIAFLLTTFILFSLAVLAIVREFNSFAQSASTKQIGTIYFKEKVAQRKFSSQPLWDPIKNGAPIYNHDSVRTESDAAAIIHLNEGTEIEIGENTLIFLKVDDKSTAIELDGGNVSAKQTGGKKLKLSTQNVEALIENGEINLVQSEDGSLMVDSSNLTSVTIDGKEVPLDETQIVKIDDQGKMQVQKAQYVLEKPAASATFITAESSKAINFSWRNNGADVNTKKVLVSTKPNFSKIDFDFSTQENKLTASFAPGLYYWKVTNQEGESGSASFRVFRDKPVLQTFPSSQAVIDYISSLPLVSFRWQPSEHAVAYKVEIFSDATLSQKVDSLLSYSNSISTDKLSQGDYYWRVVSVYPNSLDTEEIVSSVRKLQIQKVEEMKAPELLQQKEEVIVSQNMLDNKTPMLQWKDDANVDYYTIEIAKDKDFKEVEVVTTTKYNFFAPPKELNDGKHFWRVRAHAGGAKTQGSGVREFRVEKKGSIRNRLPKDEQKFFRGEPVYFAWNDTNRTNNYTIEFSFKKDFSKIISTRKSGQPNIILNDLPVENYYWRVNSLNEHNEVILTSGNSQFSIMKKQPPPKLLKPKELSVVDFSYNDELTCVWGKRKEVTAYRIRIFAKIADIDSLLYDKIVSTNSFVTSDLPSFKEIDYTWEVTALRKIGNQYNAISEIAVGHFTITLSEKLVMPKIEDSGTVFIYEK